MAFRLSLLMPVDARPADIIEAGGIRLLRLFISVELFLHDVLRFQNRLIMSVLSCISPRLASSSRFSIRCVVSCKTLKPKVPAPPLIEWAARKMAFNCSASGASGCKTSRCCSISANSSSASSKMSDKIAYIHAHAVTSVRLMALWEH